MENSQEPKKIIPQEYNMKCLPDSKLDIASAPIANPSNNDPIDVFSAILKKLKPIDFRAAGQLDPHDTLTSKNEVVIIIRQILEAAGELHLGLCSSEQQIHEYNGCFWNRVNGDEFQNFLAKASLQLGIDKLSASHHHFQEQLKKQFLSSAAQAFPSPNPGRTLINLRNGTFEIVGRRKILREPRASDFLRYQLPFSYLPSATCAQWNRFLDEVLPDNASQDVLAEYFAYVLTDLQLQKVLFLYGSGANGKSVVSNVMSAIFGEENVSHYELSQLGKETHLAMIADKLLNYSSELSRRFDQELFKKLACGEPVAVRHLYGHPYTMSRYGKLAFNCNALPRENDQNEAFYRRLLPIPFPTSVPKDKRDTNLAKKIIENELPGVFNWVLMGLDRLIKNGEFSECSESDQLLQDYRDNSDIVKEFLAEAGYQKTFQRSDFTTLQMVYEDFATFCKKAGEQPIPRSAFRPRLEENGLDCPKTKIGRIVLAKPRCKF